MLPSGFSVSQVSVSPMFQRLPGFSVSQIVQVLTTFGRHPTARLGYSSRIVPLAQPLLLGMFQNAHPLIIKYNRS